MGVRIKQGEEMIDATIEMVDGVMVVSPKEVKFEPNDGDVCVHDGMIYIFKGVKPSSFLPGKSAIIHHCYYDGEILQEKKGFGCGYIHCSQRYATEEEKKKLFDKLAEEGWEWKADTKELVKLKWKPNYTDNYWSPSLYDSEFMPRKNPWNNSETGNKRLGKGWVFKTEQECQEFCKRLNEAINQVKP